LGDEQRERLGVAGYSDLVVAVSLRYAAMCWMASADLNPETIRTLEVVLEQYFGRGLRSAWGSSNALTPLPEPA